MSHLTPKRIMRVPCDEVGPIFCYNHVCSQCNHVTHITLSMGNFLAPSDIGGQITVQETSMARDAKIEFASTSDEDDYRGADHD